MEFTSQLSPHLVLQRGSNPEVTDRWCRKLVLVCDGEITIEQAFQLLHLPFQTGQRLALRALGQHWLEPVAGQPLHTNAPLLEDFRRDLRGVLGSVPGVDMEGIIERASGMIRLDTDWLSASDISSYLLAVELLLPDQHREQLLSALDRLKMRYGA